MSSGDHFSIFVPPLPCTVAPKPSIFTYKLDQKHRFMAPLLETKKRSPGPFGLIKRRRVLVGLLVSSDDLFSVLVPPLRFTVAPKPSIFT